MDIYGWKSFYTFLRQMFWPFDLFSIRFPHLFFPFFSFFPICSWLYEPAWPASAFTHPDYLLRDVPTARRGAAEGQCWAGHMWWGTGAPLRGIHSCVFSTSGWNWICFLKRRVDIGRQDLAVDSTHSGVSEALCKISHTVWGVCMSWDVKKIQLVVTASTCRSLIHPY